MNSNQYWFWSCCHQHLYFLVLSFCLLVPSKTESIPKLKLISLSFHMFTDFLNVCLNTEKFSLHHTESEGREIWCYVAGGRCLAEPQATFLDPTLSKVFSLRQYSEVHPELTYWLIICLKAQMICLSY